MLVRRYLLLYAFTHIAALVYVGGFKNNKRHGGGVLTRANGVTEKQRFDNGLLVEWEQSH